MSGEKDVQGSGSRAGTTGRVRSIRKNKNDLDILEFQSRRDKDLGMSPDRKAWIDLDQTAADQFDFSGGDATREGSMHRRINRNSALHRGQTIDDRLVSNFLLLQTTNTQPNCYLRP